MGELASRVLKRPWRPAPQLPALCSQSTDTVPALGGPNLAGLGGTCVKQRMTVNDSPDEAWDPEYCQG